MSEYKRWISYIYSYENGEKKNNIGYARIETRDMKLKVTVHITVLSVKEPMKVYLYVREQGDIQGILIGEIKIDGGVGEGSFITSAQSVAGSTYGISDVCGLIVFYDNNKFFDFVKRAREMGVTIPIIPGIKPLAKLSQLTVVPRTFRCDLPEALAEEVIKCKTDDDAKKLGVEWGIQQSKELYAAGFETIHFYTVSAVDSVKEIAKEIL